MNSNPTQIFQVFSQSFGNVAMGWQIGIIGMSLMIAYVMSRTFNRYVNATGYDKWRVGIGGLKRSLMPITALIFISITQLILRHWQDVRLLKLASTLLLALVMIRLCIYGLRYIFNPSGWLRNMERMIAMSLWLLLALHLSGFLPDILNVLENTRFMLGKNQLNLLLVLQAFATVAATIFTTLWLSRMVENKLMQTAHLQSNSRVVLSKLVRITLMVFGLLIALSVVGIDLTLLSVFSGALGVGLGLGLQKIASNYVSGFVILLDDSIHIGDTLSIDGQQGVVSDMRARYLLLRKNNGTHVIIPNESLVINSVTNHSQQHQLLQLQLTVQISFDSNIATALALLEDAARSEEGIVTAPAPKAVVKAFGERGVDITLNVWMLASQEIAQQHGLTAAQITSNIYQAIWHKFMQNSITLASK